MVSTAPSPGLQQVDTDDAYGYEGPPSHEGKRLSAGHAYPPWLIPQPRAQFLALAIEVVMELPLMCL